MNHRVLLGKTTFRNEEYNVSLSPSDRLRHVYLIGKTGTGKSTLYQNMMRQDILAGAGCCFVDPHGEAIDWLLGTIPPHRLEDVVVFDPSDTDWPLSLNLLEWHTPTEKDFLVAEAIEIFYKLFDPEKTGVIGPQFEHWMRNAALTVMADPDGGTLIEIPRLFTDPAFEVKKRRFVTDPVVKAFWEQQMTKTSAFHRSEMLNYFTSKFGRFTTNSLMRNIIGQRQSTISLADALEQQKIVLVNLSKGEIGETNAFMLGLILMTKLQMAVMKRASVPVEERTPFYLYVDEFHNVMTDAFIDMLSEARKYGLAVHLANQYITQLTESVRNAVLGNAGTLIAFQVGAQDTAVLLREFDTQQGKRRSDQLKEDDFLYLARHHFYIRPVIEGITRQPFRCVGFPPEAATGNLSANDVRTVSRLRFGLPVRQAGLPSAIL